MNKLPTFMHERNTSRARNDFRLSVSDGFLYALEAVSANLELT